MENKPALALTAVGVVSLLLTGVFLSSAQSTGDAPRGDWDTTTSTGEITLGDGSYHSVFQGERDIQGWKNTDGDDVTGRSLTRRGRSGSLSLEGRIDRDQPIGRYESPDGDLTATVRRPRVDLELFNTNGVRISSGASVGRNSKVLVRADWNFVEAEDIQIEVREPDGTRATRVALSDDPSDAQSDLLPGGFSEDFLDSETQGTGSTDYSTAYWLVDTSDLSGGTNEIRVEGVEDLDFDVARSTVRLRVGSGTRPSLTLGTSEPSRGERVRFRIGGGGTGQYYAVAFERGDLRDGADPEAVFRLAGDTVRTGATEEYAYGVVRVSDTGEALGQFESRGLRTGSRSIRVFEPAGSADEALDELRDGDEVDRLRFSIEEGRLTIRIEGMNYATGSSVDVSGTASPGIDSVAVYVRDRGDWHLLPLNGRDTTSVRSDGTWRARNVVLSEEEPGGRVFRFPGNYRLGVVDADVLGSPPPRFISPSEFGRLRTSLSSVGTKPPTFVASFNTFGRQVAEGDRVSFTGTSTGANEMVVAFVGDRGVRATVVRNTRGSFVDRQISLEGMRRGEVTAFAFAPGRDGEFGDGSATDANGDRVSVSRAQDLRGYIRSFDRDGRTRAQRVERIRNATVESAGSDDLFRTTTFRITDPRTTIRDTVPGDRPELAGVVPIEQGETVLVRGTTNRNPEDAVVDVEITEGPDTGAFDPRTVRSWRGDGIWSVSFSTTEVPTGTYTVEVGDGDSGDSMSFTVVEDREADLDDLGTLRERLNEIQGQMEFLRNQNEDLNGTVADLRAERDRLQQELGGLEEREGDEAVDEQPSEAPDTDTLGFVFRIAAALVVVFGAVIVIAAALVFVFRRR